MMANSGDMSSRSLRRAAVFAALLSATAAPALAHQAGTTPTQKAIAKGSDDKPSEMGEIIVTARFRGENIQKAPLSITALSGAQLEARGVSRIEEASQFTPGVTLQQNTGGFGKSILAFIRGVGQNDVLPAFEPGVGIYVDDVYHGTLQGALFELTDVGQVEILRGPQGTLFGKNNEGGAVRITSTRPRGDNSGFVEAGLGSYNRMQIRGAFDLGLVHDKLALRVSGGANSYQGHVRLIDFVCAHPELSGTLPRTKPLSQDGNCWNGLNGGSDVKAVKANLLFTPFDQLEVNLIADLTDDKGQPTGEKLLAVNTHPPSALGGFGPIPGYGDPSATGFGIPYDSRFITDSPYTTYTTYTDFRTGQTFPKTNDLRSWGLAGKLVWRFSPNLSLTSITGYRAYSGEYTEIWGNAPIHIDDNYFKPKHRQFTEELRLHGSLWNDLLDWTVGGYYYKSHTELNAFIYLPVVLIFNVFDPSATKPGLVFFGKDPVKDKDTSAFAHIVVRPVQGLSLEGGLRYSDVSKRYTFNRNVPAGYPFSPSLPGFEGNPSVTSKTNRMDYRLAAQYQWTPSVMTYVSFSTGFKAPGVNPRPSSIDEVLPFAEEDLKSYEIGLKSRTLGNRLRFNLSGYLSDYTNLQLSTITPNRPGTTVANAGKVRITGIEAESQAEPVDNLLIDATLSYLHFKYRDLGFAAGVPDGPCSSCTAEFVPNWQVSVGMQYKLALGRLGSLTPRVDWSYRSKVYNDLPNSEIASTPGYSLVNARLGFDSIDDRWGLSLEVKNVTNKVYYVNKFNQLNSAGILVGQLGLPRTFLVSVRRNFR